MLSAFAYGGYGLEWFHDGFSQQFDEIIDIARGKKIEIDGVNLWLRLRELVELTQYMGCLSHAPLRYQRNIGIVDAVSLHQMKLIFPVVEQVLRHVRLNNKRILYNFYLSFRVQIYTIIPDYTKCVMNVKKSRNYVANSLNLACKRIKLILFLPHLILK